jgi:hypothetical protein
VAGLTSTNPQRHVEATAFAEDLFFVSDWGLFDVVTNVGVGSANTVPPVVVIRTEVKANQMDVQTVGSRHPMVVVERLGTGRYGLVAVKIVKVECVCVWTYHFQALNLSYQKPQKEELRKKNSEGNIENAEKKRPPPRLE